MQFIGIESPRALGGSPRRLELIGHSPAMDSAAECLWLKQHEPYHFQRAASLLTIQDFIAYWLTRERATESGSATGSWLGMASSPNTSLAPEVLKRHNGGSSEEHEAVVANDAPGADGLQMHPYFAAESQQYRVDTLHPAGFL